jgi:predicted lipoprotein
MNENEKRRRAVAAQGFAALAFFVFAHGAHAATPRAHPLVRPAALSPAPSPTQLRRA